MSESSSTRKLALGILAVCLLALVVGLVNAGMALVNKKESEAADSRKSSVANLLGSSAIKKNRLMMVEVIGPITSEPGSGPFSEDPMAVSARKALDYAAKDDSVKGVLLRIDSPGGTVGMSQELNAAVKRVRAKKPVVASLGDLAASGGYYTACAADKIVSNPGTLTASIGVIISSMNLQGLLENKLGIKPVTIKSGKFKDILSPYRPARPEEVQLVQNIIDGSYQDFLGAVLDGRTRHITDATKRKQLSDKIRAVADGRIVLGSQALAVGLVDELGDTDKAWTLLNNMAKERFNLRGKERLPLEEYSETPAILQMLGLGAASHLLPTSGMGDWRQKAVESAMPFSMRYPNQPLWIME